MRLHKHMLTPLERIRAIRNCRYTMESMNETNSVEHDKEIQGSSTKGVVKKNDKNAYGSETKICSIKPKSVQSKGKQLVSGKPVKLKSSKQRRTKVNDIYNDVEAEGSVIRRAIRVLYSLEYESLCFLKCMLPSNVCYSFWMIFPAEFSKSHLPNCDSTVTLVDELGVECKTTYLFVRHGLSAGWRGFSISHKLRKGDFLIFQLIDHCKFKVHIVRLYDPDVVDAANCLMHMVASSGTTDPDLGQKQARRCKKKKKYADAEAAYVR